MYDDDLDQIAQTGSGALARLLDTGNSSGAVWSASEMGDVLAHQLSVPLAVELCVLEGVSESELRTLCSGAKPGIATFADLLSHVSPPRSLLDLVKRYAKRHRKGDSGLPGEVATVIYFTAIAQSLRCQLAPITRLRGDSLRRGLAWVQSRPWIDESIRTVVTAGMASVEGAEQI